MYSAYKICDKSDIPVQEIITWPQYIATQKISDIYEIRISVIQLGLNTG